MDLSQDVIDNENASMRWTKRALLRGENKRLRNEVEEAELEAKVEEIKTKIAELEAMTERGQYNGCFVRDLFEECQQLRVAFKKLAERNAKWTSAEYKALAEDWELLQSWAEVIGAACGIGLAAFRKELATR